MGLVYFVVLMLISFFENGSAVPGCPLYFVRNAESCYHIFDNPTLTWTVAMSFCQQYGDGEGSLAVVESDAEEKFLQSQLLAKYPGAGQTRDFWLGANDLASEGNWVWIRTNSMLDYSNWAPGEPSSGTQENCLALLDNLGFRWNDAPCNLPEAFICETPYSGDLDPQIGK